MSALNFYNSFVEQLAEKAHNLGSDALKVALTNTAPNPAHTSLSQIGEIAAGNGYAAGGAAATVVSSAQTGGAYKLVLTGPTFAASGGGVGPFRYAVLYNGANDALIGWADYGSSISLSDGEQFPVEFDADAGAIAIAPEA